jgi:hypothetical protein
MKVYTGFAKVAAGWVRLAWFAAVALSLSPVMQAASPTGSWTLLKRSDYGADLYGAEVQGNTVVAVGKNTINLSLDGGVTWGATSIGASRLYGVVYAGGQFVGYGAVWSSGGGGGPGVIDEINSAIYTSPDGTAWTQRPSVTSNGLYGLTYGNSLWVAVGKNGTIITSPDAATWTVRTSNTLARLNGIAYGNGCFAAVGEVGTIVTSPDGIAWTVQTSGTLNHLNAVAYGNGTFTAVGASGIALRSANGTSGWLSGSTGSSGTMRSIAFGNGVFVASGAGIYSSADGAAWAAMNDGYYDLRSLRYGSGRFIGVNQTGDVIASKVGSNWIFTPRVSGTTNDLHGVAYGVGKFVAVGVGGTILTSPDGITWTPRNSGVTETLFGVARGDDCFAAVGAAGRVVTSVDGITWVPRHGATDETLRAVAYGHTLFVAVGTNGIVSMSPSYGDSWSSLPSGVSVTLNDITFGGGVFVACGLRGGTAYSAPLLTSTFGWTWTNHLPANYDYVGVSYLGGQFLAFNLDGVHASADGASWGAAPLIRVGPSAGSPVYQGYSAFASGSGFAVGVTTSSVDSFPDSTAGLMIGNTRDSAFMSPQFKDVAHGNGTFVVVGTGGAIRSAKLVIAAIVITGAPVHGGQIGGGGGYAVGETVNLTAVPLNGLEFQNWTEGASVVSSSPSYSFTAGGDRNLVAHFWVPVYYDVTTSSSPPAGGSTSGGGHYLTGTFMQVRATANSGYAFVSWTDGGTMVCNLPDYAFTVDRNRTLVANFGLAATLTVQANPPGGGTVSGGGSFLIGSERQISASPAAGWKFVDWNDAVTANPRWVTVPDGGVAYEANFTLRTLIPHDDEAFTAGKAGAVIHVLDNDTTAWPLTITSTSTPGVGSVAVNPDGTVTYTPSAAYVDTDTFTYTVSDGHGETASATVTVHNGFLLGAGTYAGISSGGSLTNETAGSLRATMNSKGQFTATLKLLGKNYTLRGTITANSTWQRVFLRPAPQAPLVVTLHLQAGTRQLSAEIFDGSTTTWIAADRLTYNARTAPAPQAGKYTALLPAQPHSPVLTVPQGTGYLRIVVNAGGSATVVGRLGDGTLISTAGLLVSDETLPIFVRLYGLGAYRGTVSGYITFVAAGAPNDCDGTLYWFKPGQLRGRYAAGFATTSDLIGSRYTPPPRGTRVLDLATNPGNAMAEFDCGGLATPMAKVVTLWQTNLITVEAPGTDRLSMVVTPLSGVVSGSFMDMGVPAKRTFHGLVLQKQKLAGGYFMGTEATGYMKLTPH